MGRVLLFWMSQSPHPDMPAATWRGFVDSVAGWLLGSVLLVSLGIVALYISSAHHKRIRHPGDAFGPYTPLYWLWLSLVSVAVVFVVYVVMYRDLFPGAPVSSLAGGVPAALWAGVLTFLVSHILVCLPGVTPPKFRYRPLWFLHGRRRRASENVTSGM